MQMELEQITHIWWACIAVDPQPTPVKHGPIIYHHWLQCMLVIKSLEKATTSIQ